MPARRQRLLRHALRAVTLAAAGITVAAACQAIGPAFAGGPISHGAVTGTSMEPSLRAGDLVILRVGGPYEPGDVVAYRSPTAGRIVLHRIVSAGDARYVTRGDSNADIDVYKPTRSDIIGKQLLRIPAAGRIIQSATMSLVAVTTLLAIALAVLPPRSRCCTRAVAARR